MQRPRANSYRKVGVMLNGLSPAGQLSLRMYDDEKWERFRDVMTAVDAINRRWGRDTVRLGAANPAVGVWLIYLQGGIPAPDLATANGGASTSGTARSHLL